jgi:hypothetical protein
MEIANFPVPDHACEAIYKCRLCGENIHWSLESANAVPQIRAHRCYENCGLCELVGFVILSEEQVQARAQARAARDATGAARVSGGEG